MKNWLSEFGRLFKSKSCIRAYSESGNIRERRNAFRDFAIGSIFIEKDGFWRLIETIPEQSIPEWNGGGGGGNRLILEKLTPEETIVHEIMAC